VGVLVPAISGLSDGVLLFLVASGLTLIFGVMGILNFAHGGMFMLGAYFGYVVASALNTPSVWSFVLVIALATVAIGGVSLVVERVVFRRLYQLSELHALLGTYALLLILEGAAQLIWGLRPLSEALPVQLSGFFALRDTDVPVYSLLLLVLGAIVLAFLQWLVYGTHFGQDLRAVAEDALMARLLGVDTKTVFQVTVIIGTMMAGLGGALAAPTLALTPDVAGSFIIQAFAVVIIGGMGSIYGSLVAALLVGVFNSMLVAYAPGLAGYSLYIVLAAVLLLRPRGLLGSMALEEAQRS
jgi:branched-subunit amino acid ABC-type transport system permease component